MATSFSKNANTLQIAVMLPLLPCKLSTARFGQGQYHGVLKRGAVVNHHYQICKRSASHNYLFATGESLISLYILECQWSKATSLG
jgi:hypothetical protein